MHDIMKIGKKVAFDMKKQNVTIPANYVPENALKSAWLILQNTYDKNKQPVLEVCTEVSIYNAVLDMFLQGLNPLKKQCGFVAYGRILKLQREYQGDKALAKRVDNRIVDIRAQPIYKNDELKIRVVNGMQLIEHNFDFMKASKENIIGAYAIAVDENDNQIASDIMTLDEIKTAWKKSKQKPVSESGMIDKDSTHGKFTEEMTRKSVVKRLCKSIINSSDDQMLIESTIRTDEEMEVAEIISEQTINDDRKLIDFDAAIQKTRDKHPDFTEEEAMNATVGSSKKQVMMSTDDQCRQIFDIEKEKNAETNIKHTLSAFVMRQITGLKQLTYDEAQSYIDRHEQEKRKVNRKPAWK